MIWRNEGFELRGLKMPVPKEPLSKGIQVCAATLFHGVVCSPLGREETQEIVCREFPSGTSNNWELEEMAHACPVRPGSKHWGMVT